jgi:hypothetical protein
MSPAESNWFAQILAHLSIQQAECFVVHGDIAGYPEVPGEGLIEYLRRMTLAPARDQAMESSGDQWDSLGKRSGMSPAQAKLAASEFQADLVAATQIIVELSPSRGLIADRADLVAFEKLSPPPDNPFAVQDLAACFRRVDRYFQASATTEDAPSLCAILHDADLVFDGGGPLVEPERTLISYIHHWTSSPLLTSSGMPHRIYLVSPSAVGMRPAVLQGRVSQVRVPLPTTETRTDFIVQVLDLANRSGAVRLTEGMEARDLARITGALNLTQIEDVIYQAAAADGIVTNDLAQARKDELVAATYGGVLEIEYPTDGFSTIYGCDLLKGYFRDYAYPLLAKGSPACPKGALLVGPPGTGKTCFARALAAEVQLPLVIIRMDKLKDKFVGESNKRVARLCEGILALAPCVVLADELDKIMPESDDSTGVSQEILGQLQTFLSDVPRGTAFFLATTNYPARVPRALLRPGRFESTIPVLPQHLDGYRGQLLQALGSRSEYRVADGIDYEAVVKDAGDYAGADLEKLVLEADFERQQCGAEVITQEHFVAALGYVVPTVRMAGEMVEQALAYTSSPRFVPESLRPQVGRPAVAAEDGAAPAPRRQIRKIV